MHRMNADTLYGIPITLRFFFFFQFFQGAILIKERFHVNF